MNWYLVALAIRLSFDIVDYRQMCFVLICNVIKEARFPGLSTKSIHS